MLLSCQDIVVCCRPILKTELGSCISRLSRNQQQGFNAEFTDLSARFIAGETSVAEAFYNKMKNRRSGSVPGRYSLHFLPIKLRDIRFETRIFTSSGWDDRSCQQFIAFTTYVVEIMNEEL